MAAFARSRRNRTAIALAIAVSAAACGGPTPPPAPTAPTAQAALADADRVAIAARLLATGLDAVDLTTTPPSALPSSVNAASPVPPRTICPAVAVTLGYGRPLGANVRTSCGTMSAGGQIAFSQTIDTVAASDTFTSCLGAACRSVQVTYVAGGHLDISGQVQPTRRVDGTMSWSGVLQASGSFQVQASGAVPVTIALTNVSAQLADFSAQSGGSITGSFLDSGSSPLPQVAPMPRAGGGGLNAPDSPLLLAGTYQLIAINGKGVPQDVGLLDRFPPSGGCDLTIDSGSLVLTGDNAGPSHYTLSLPGRRSNCKDGSGNPYQGGALSCGEAGAWSLPDGTLAFTNVPGGECQIDKANYSAFMIVLAVTAYPQSNGGPFHLVLAFAKT